VGKPSAGTYQCLLRAVRVGEERKRGWMDFVKVPSFLFRFLLLSVLSADCVVRVLSRRRASKRQKTAFYFRSDRDYV